MSNRFNRRSGRLGAGQLEGPTRTEQGRSSPRGESWTSRSSTAADERRRQSAEVELGTNWFDAKGSRYELSWVEDTGELYTMLELIPEADSFTPFGDIEVENLPVDRILVMVVGYIGDPGEVEDVLSGWPERMAEPDGISWVAERLRANRRADRPPRPDPPGRAGRGRAPYGVGPDGATGPGSGRSVADGSGGGSLHGAVMLGIATTCSGSRSWPFRPA